MVRVVLGACLNRVATKAYLKSRSRRHPLYSAAHRNEFLDYLLGTNHPAVVRLQAQAAAGLLGHDPAEALQNVLDTDIEELKHLVLHVDAWGSYVGAVRGDLSPALAPPVELCQWRSDLKQDITFWLQQKVPGYCLSAVGISCTAQNILDDMESALRAPASSYRYKQDLWLWALPLLTRQLVKALIPAAQHLRPGLDLHQAQQWLDSVVPAALGNLHQTFGIRDIDGDAVKAAVLLAVMSMDEAQYARVCARPGGLEQCLKALLLQELERQVRATFLPQPLSCCPGGGDAQGTQAWVRAEVLLRRWWLDTYRRLADSGQGAVLLTEPGPPGRRERKILKDELGAAVHNAPRGALPSGLKLWRTACLDLDPRHMRTEPELRRLVRSRAVSQLCGDGMVPAALNWSPGLPADRDARFGKSRSVRWQRALVLWLRPADGCVASLPALAYLLDDLRGKIVDVQEVVAIPAVIDEVVHTFSWHCCTARDFLMDCRKELMQARRRPRASPRSQHRPCSRQRPREFMPPPSYDDVIAWVAETRIAKQPAAQVVGKLKRVAGCNGSVTPPVSRVRANTTRARKMLIEEMSARVRESTAFWLAQVELGEGRSCHD